MANLVINRIKIKAYYAGHLYLMPNSGLLFEKDAGILLKKLEKESSHDVQEVASELRKRLSLNEDLSGRKISFSFKIPQTNQPYYSIKLGQLRTFYFRKFYIKEHLLSFFDLNDFIVEPFPIASDFCVYKKVRNHSDRWGVFHKFNISIFPFENEISISIGSYDSLISEHTLPVEEGKRGIDTEGYLRPLKHINSPRVRILANYEKRFALGYSNKILSTFYKNSYQTLNSFYEFLLKNLRGSIEVEGGGFKTVNPADIGKVDFDKNLMLFGKNHSDVNAASGMRDGGPFYIPKEKTEGLKLIFIYQNKEQANSLYLSLKKGLKHYPGLLSYVGVPVNIANEKLQYTNAVSLKDDFNAFFQTVLTEDFYSNHFAIVILPFTRENATQNDTQLYYYMKEQLLKKGIASQDINENKINSSNFHYHLPNISIAILAKLGGVPWKLKRKAYNELIIGFNETRLGNEVMLGTAVYFDNTGKLQQIKAFKKVERDQLIIALRDSINAYLNNNDEIPERLVIHYYKTPRYEDVDSIQKLIKNEFRFNIPFALVEINDSKTSNEICFDLGYNHGMPTSGTFVTIDRNEFILFNNLRYWDNPTKPVQSEEYPVKIRIYNFETGGFTYRELLSQVYEFSRLYWKGLKQKSQPVTTQYSKIIADFAMHFEGNELPRNEIIDKTAWFI